MKVYGRTDGQTDDGRCAMIIAHLSLRLRLAKNTNMVDDIEIKTRSISFSGLRREVQNVSENQRPGWSSCSSNQPEKHNLG